MKSSNDEILRFIASSFRSVWALELLLVLKSELRPWSHDDLDSTMRASKLVVTKALGALEAAGFVTSKPRSSTLVGRTRFAGRSYPMRPLTLRPLRMRSG